MISVVKQLVLNKSFASLAHVESVSWISQVILLSNEHGDWDLCDVLKDNKRNCLASIVIDVALVTAPIVLLENTLINDLGIVKNLPDGGV